MSGSATRMRLIGGAALRDKLLGMSKNTGALALMPIVVAAAGDLASAARTRAPRRTGALAGSIKVEFIKGGAGYAYCLIAPDEDHYYGLFQEYGLGSGRATPVQGATQRRRANFAASAAVRQQLRQRGVLPAEILAAAYNWKNQRAPGMPFGLSKGEMKRQVTLASGRHLQGQRRPNMAAHPFMRPAIDWRWPWIRRWIAERLAGLVLRYTDGRTA